MTLGMDTIDVVRAALTTDPRYGSQGRDWTAATTTTIDGVSVQPATSTETTVGREYTAGMMTLYAPAGADVVATDRVVWRGLTYEVDGEPMPWVDDRGVPDHLEVSLTRMVG